jgi:hypothetical protein
MLATHRIHTTIASPKTLLLAGLTTGHMVNDFYSMQQFPLLACESYTTYVGGCPCGPFGD